MVPDAKAVAERAAMERPAARAHRGAPDIAVAGGHGGGRKVPPGARLQERPRAIANLLTRHTIARMCTCTSCVLPSMKIRFLGGCDLVLNY